MKKIIGIINKRAWEIRRNAALQYNCNVVRKSDGKDFIVWGPCFRQAKAELADKLVALKASIEKDYPSLTARLWEKGGKRRLYVAHTTNNRNKKDMGYAFVGDDGSLISMFKDGLVPGRWAADAVREVNGF